MSDWSESETSFPNWLLFDTLRAGDREVISETRAACIVYWGVGGRGRCDDQNKGRSRCAGGSAGGVLRGAYLPRAAGESEPHRAAPGFSPPHAKALQMHQKRYGGRRCSAMARWPVGARVAGRSPRTDFSVIAAVKLKQIRRGVKEVQKFVNKGEKDIMVLVGDTLSIEVHCHLPYLCEDWNLPYIYILSKTDLGAAAGSKRPTCVIMVRLHEEYQEAYEECLQEVHALTRRI